MTKTNTMLSRILTTKSAKIIASFLILVVLISSFAIYSFADDGPPMDSFISGSRLFATDPFIGVSTALSELDTLVYVTSGTPLIYGRFQSDGEIYIGLGFLDSSSSNVPTFQGKTVYTKQFGWSNQVNRLIDFGSGVTIDQISYNYYLDNSSSVDNTAFMQGYLSGLEQVIYNSEAELNQARAEGYSIGYRDGRNSTDSENLGENLLGSTLSAPFEALNDFTIYKSTSGFEVTLGLVIGGAICLTLFMAFLKIFAGG